MNTLPFVIWVIGWPFSCGLLRCLYKRSGIEYSDAVRGFAALIECAIWLWIGILLWNK